MTRVKAIPMSALDAVQLHRDAHAAGMAALAACTPRPMIVSQHASPIDDRSAVVQQWREPEGLCGFAWVEVRPSRGGFATYARDAGIGRHSEYNKCCTINVREGGQSYERKLAFAEAYAKVLSAKGIDAYANGRLD